MKHFLLRFSALVLWIPSMLAAEEIDTRRHIEVQGTAQVFAEVDRAIAWQIKVRGEADTLEASSNLLNVSIASLEQRLFVLKIPKEALRLSGITSGRVYEKQREVQVFKGYFVERQVAVEISDLGLRQGLEKALLADDRIEIVRVNLKSSKHEELRKRSLISAVAAARAKAEFLAEELGAVLGAALSVREGAHTPFWGGLTSNRIEMPVFGNAEAAEFEKLDYSATVTVKFELK